MNMVKMAGLLSLSLALCACNPAAQQNINNDQQSSSDKSQAYSGFLSSYKDLEEIKAEDNSLVKRYISPELKQRGYNKIMVDALQYFPAPKPNDSASRETLSAISEYTNDTFALAIRNTATLATEPGDRTIRLKVAITELNVVDKDSMDYRYLQTEFLSSEAVNEAAELIVKFTIEVEVLDSRSSETLARVVKTGFGESMKAGEPITLDKVKPLLDIWRETMQKSIVEQL
ncbi:DUF3313 domain-containing protein [Thalassotalea aquiviva]|uniref:DUF3313 domain-containing protein n=1 Tax=Thalassotalea aquiviva TaxID=3242415 RepID=UPI00352BAE7F